MTKYVLHGGGAKLDTVENEKFLAEILKGFEDGVKILLVYFAKDRGAWREKFAEEVSFWGRSKTGIKPIFTLASEDNAEFCEQIKTAEIIFLRGGDDLKLLNKLKKIRDFAQLIKHKVVAGSSAGALVLTKHYYTNDYDQFVEGLGILPIKLICHFRENNKVKEKELELQGKVFPVITLKEQEWIVVTN